MVKLFLGIPFNTVMNQSDMFSFTESLKEYCLKQSEIVHDNCIRFMCTQTFFKIIPVADVADNLIINLGVTITQRDKLSAIMHSFHPAICGTKANHKHLMTEFSKHNRTFVLSKRTCVTCRIFE